MLERPPLDHQGTRALDYLQIRFNLYKYGFCRQWWALRVLCKQHTDPTSGVGYCKESGGSERREALRQLCPKSPSLVCSTLFDGELGNIWVMWGRSGKILRLDPCQQKVARRPGYLYSSLQTTIFKPLCLHVFFFKKRERDLFCFSSSFLVPCMRGKSLAWGLPTGLEASSPL